MSTEKIGMVLSRKDQAGNRLSYDEQTGEVQMSQSNEPDRWRPIGKIANDDGILIYQKFEKEKDKYQKYNAWSVYYLITELVDVIRYETESFVYYIEKSKLIKNSLRQIDKGHGKGMKYVCPIKYWDVQSKDQKYKNTIKNVGVGWFEQLYPLFSNGGMSEISRNVSKARKGSIVFPEKDLTFNAFKKTNFAEVKCVVINDFPDNEDDYDGLAFSLKDSIKPIPETQKNLHAWIEEDVYDGFNLNSIIDLEPWAEQGVLLLNSVLTCNFYSTQAHKDFGWQKFVGNVLDIIATAEHHTPIVFILLGDEVSSLYQKRLEDANKNSKHLIITAPHPRDGVPEHNAFSLCNKFLKQNNLQEIRW